MKTLNGEQHEAAENRCHLCAQHWGSHYGKEKKKVQFLNSQNKKYGKKKKQQKNKTGTDFEKKKY